MYKKGRGLGVNLRPSLHLGVAGGGLRECGFAVQQLLGAVYLTLF